MFKKYLFILLFPFSMQPMLGPEALKEIINIGKKLQRLNLFNDLDKIVKAGHAIPVWEKGIIKMTVIPAEVSTSLLGIVVGGATGLASGLAATVHYFSPVPIISAVTNDIGQVVNPVAGAASEIAGTVPFLFKLYKDEVVAGIRTANRIKRAQVARDKAAQEAKVAREKKEMIEEEKNHPLLKENITLAQAEKLAIEEENLFAHTPKDEKNMYFRKKYSSMLNDKGLQITPPAKFHIKQSVFHNPANHCTIL